MAEPFSADGGASAGPGANPHDLVRYPDLPFPQTHPVALGVVAALFGKPFVPFAAARVLEIGCGGGVNLLSMALGAPAARFVGVDLAERPIALARAAAQACGVANVTFHARDIRDLDVSLGRFDYIIAHGVYAWVPADVRQALMRLIGALLTEHGLALISYNAHPGGHLRCVLRDVMMAGAEGALTPADGIERARAALAAQIDRWSATDSVGGALVHAARRILAQPQEVLFHDELTAFYEPQLLADVVAAAKRVGLDYLGDAQPQFSAEAFFPSGKFAGERASAAGDWVRFEQLMDFSEMCSFRSSIFCRGGGADRRREAQRLRGLWASGELTPAAPNAEEPGSVAFLCEGGARITTNNPAAADFLAGLGAAYPACAPLDAAADQPGLVQYVLTLFVSGAIRIVTAPLPFALTAGERPLASPLARFQASRGEKAVASLRHSSVELEDAAALRFVTLLDGSRTRADLARETAAPGASPAAAAAQVEAALTSLTRLGLMMA